MPPFDLIRRFFTPVLWLLVWFGHGYSAWVPAGWYGDRDRGTNTASSMAAASIRRGLQAECNIRATIYWFQLPSQHAKHVGATV